MTERPTQQQIDDAKAFVERRLLVQQEVVDELHSEFREAAERIVAIVLKYKSRDMALRFSGGGMMATEIQEVIDWIQLRIDEHILNSSVPPEEEDEEDIESIVEHIRDSYFGATFDDRRDTYLAKYIALLKEAGLDDFDLDEEEILEAIIEATDAPVHRMELLVSNTVAMGWSMWALQEAVENSAVGFYVINGRNPCSFCADKSGYLHKIGDEIPPYHPSCQCLAVYI